MLDGQWLAKSPAARQGGSTGIFASTKKTVNSLMSLRFLHVVLVERYVARSVLSMPYRMPAGTTVADCWPNALAKPSDARMLPNECPPSTKTQSFAHTCLLCAVVMPRSSSASDAAFHWRDSCPPVGHTTVANCWPISVAFPASACCSPDSWWL